MSEYCKYCGQAYGDARTLLHNTCTRHPGGRGNHALFEGDTNGPFYCVHCGQKYTSLRTLLLNTCIRNPNGRSHALFLASGATDAGDDKYAWDSFEKVADIADGQESYTYTVPVALRDGRPLRFFLLQTTGLAMAKELDKVHSTGAQWVNVELVPDGRTTTDFRFGNVTYANSTAFFGQN